MSTYKRVNIIYMSHLQDVIQKLTKLIQEDTEQDPQYLAGCFSTLVGIEQLLEDLAIEHYILDMIDPSDLDLPDA